MDILTVGILGLAATFLMGLLNCYYGYRFFIVTVAIIGFLIGAYIGSSLGSWVGGSMLVVILGVVVGLIAAWGSVSGYYAFIFVVGAFGFAFLAAFLSGLYSENASTILAIVVGLLGGFLSLWLQRVIIIIATAAQGALASVLAVAALAKGGGMQAYLDYYYSLLDGELAYAAGLWFYLGLLIWLVLFVSGMLAQFRRGKEMYRENPLKRLKAPT